MSFILPAGLTLYAVVDGTHKRWTSIDQPNERFYHTSLLSAVNMAGDGRNILECKVVRDIAIKNVLFDNEWVIRDPMRRQVDTLYEAGLGEFAIEYTVESDKFAGTKLYLTITDDDYHIGTLFLNRADWDKVRYNRVFYYVDTRAFKQYAFKHRCVLQHSPYEFEKMTDYVREGIVRKRRT